MDYESDVEQYQAARARFTQRSSKRLFEACWNGIAEMLDSHGPISDIELDAALQGEAGRLVNDESSPFYIIG